MLETIFQEHSQKNFHNNHHPRNNKWAWNKTYWCTFIEWTQDTVYSVTIKAHVISFESHAFANCPKLSYINIPSTVERIEDNAVQCYDVNQHLRIGTLIVSFDINPRVNLICDQNFAFKEFTHIYLCEKISPLIYESAMKDTIVTVFAPSSFTFNNIQTSLTYTCKSTPPKKTFCHQNSSIQIHLTFLFITLLISTQ